MDGHTELLITIAVALGLAFSGGYLARLVRVPTIAGYMLAGVLISPFTPGFDADLATLQQLAELGVIFLMFGIGLHFDIADLLSVRKVAVPGGFFLIAVVTGVGFLIAKWYGLPMSEGFTIGVAMAIASSAVLSRALIDNGLVESESGRIAVGWSIVEDLSTVAFLALLPSLAEGNGSFDYREMGLALLRAFAFVGIILIAGPRIIPHVLRRVAVLGSRELFILGVVALALGIAASATVFDVSVALGAFLAGVVISETEMGHQATADVLPLREAFGVLFFVSVGMLLDPSELLGEIDLLAVVTSVVVAGKFVVVLLLFALFPYSGRVALTVAAGLAQIGEFSFLVLNAGLSLGLIQDSSYNVLLAAAVISIVLNPLLFLLVPTLGRLLQNSGPIWRLLNHQGPVPQPGAPPAGHVVIIGFGRVGELTGHALDSAGVAFVVVESSLDRARRLSEAKRLVVWGDAGSEAVLEKAGVVAARLVVVALPDENSTYLAVTNVRRIAPRVPIIVRAHAREELVLLRAQGVEEVVVPEFEGGLELMHQALVRLGYSNEDAEGYRLAIRDTHYGTEAHAID